MSYDNYFMPLGVRLTNWLPPLNKAYFISGNIFLQWKYKEIMQEISIIWEHNVIISLKGNSLLRVTASSSNQSNEPVKKSEIYDSLTSSDGVFHQIV